MLKVRLMHEDRAKKDVREAEERQKKAEKSLEACQEELARYRIWRPEEEDRRYAAIFGKPMDAKKLATFREELACLAQGEVERELKVHEAEKVVQQRVTETEAARKAAIMARRASMKLEEHRDIWQAAMRKEEERLSDLEMEELRGPAKNIL